jgi:hypothetical protein
LLFPPQKICGVAPAQSTSQDDRPPLSGWRKSADGLSKDFGSFNNISMPTTVYGQHSQRSQRQESLAESVVVAYRQSLVILKI